MKLQRELHIVLVALLLISFGCKKNKTQPIPIIYGHAGAALSPERAVFPPNTERAILYGLDVLNADGVEVDVQLTKDSILVLYHNNLLEDFTNLTGCINDYNYEEIVDAEYYKSDKLLVLSNVLEWCINRKKRIYIDIKQFNFCENRYIDFSSLNYALSIAFSPYSKEEKKWITVNSRNADILLAIEEEDILKNYETEELDKGIDAIHNYGFDKLLFRLSTFSEEKAIKLKKEEIKYGIFGIKTKQDLNLLKNYEPVELISDNISATRKYYY